jgi:hypothetical protein
LCCDKCFGLAGYMDHDLTVSKIGVINALLIAPEKQSWAPLGRLTSDYNDYAGISAIGNSIKSSDSIGASIAAYHCLVDHH